MSSVIVQDQPQSSIQENNTSESTSVQESQPELIGLGPLRSANKLFIKQRIRASDICALLTGCEVMQKMHFAVIPHSILSNSYSFLAGHSHKNLS